MLLVIVALSGPLAGSQEPGGATLPLPTSSQAPAALEAMARFEPGGRVEGAWRRRMVDQRFALAPLLEPTTTARREVLVRITRDKRETLGLDDADVTLTSTAWIGPEPIDPRDAATFQAWQIVDHADRGDFWGDVYYRTRLDPVGPGNPTDRYYDRANGRLIFAATVDPLNLGRYGFRRALHLAYFEAAGFDAPACLGEHGLGLLSLVQADGRRRDVVVSDPTGRTTPWAPEWQLVDPASGRALASATPGGPAPERLDLVLVYERSEPGSPSQARDVTLRLGLRDGEFDLADSQLPSPYLVTPVDCDLAKPLR
jgi:hypothetical protein